MERVPATFETPPFLETLPDELKNVPYNGKHFPGSHAHVALSRGMNCQRFAYEVVRLFGLHIPDFRSSELWEDSAFTARVCVPRPLDLALFNHKDDPWGAHIGVFVAPSAVLHLCREVGRPAVWDPNEFATRPRYRTVVGFKRIVS